MTTGNQIITIDGSELTNQYQSGGLAAPNNNNQYTQTQAPQPAVAQDVIDLGHLYQTILRHKWSVLLILSLVFSFGMLYTLSISPTYKASTTIKIDQESGKVISYNVYEQQAIDANYNQTQINLLKSRKLASRVIEQLDLKAYYETHQVKRTYVGQYIDWLKAMVASSDTLKVDEMTALVDGEENENLGAKPIELKFLSHLEVVPVAKSNIVQLSYISDDPKMAAKIVNAIAEGYIDMSLEAKGDTSTYAKKFISEQLAKVKKKLQTSEKELVGYAKKNKIINTDDNGSIISSELQALSTAYIEAQNKLNTAESDYKEKNKVSGAIRLMDNAVIQGLKQKQAGLQEEYTQLSEIYKPGYPQMVQIKKQLNTVRQQIKRETATISRGSSQTLKAEYLAAKKNTFLLKSQLDSKKQEILMLRDKNIGYQVIEREVKTNRELYNSLLQRRKEIGVASGAVSNNISIIDPAFVPYKKFKPNTTRNLLISGLLGLILGALFAIFKESKDDRIETRDEIEAFTGLPIIGVFPYVKGKESPLLINQEGRSAVNESFRSIAVDLKFSTEAGIPKVLHITSSAPSEGKSSTTINLAMVMAQEDKKVLIIDCDLRKPSVHKYFKVPNKVGLTEYLIGEASLDQVLIGDIVPNVSIIPAGYAPNNPIKLLAGDNMIAMLADLSEEYDQIIIDSPPILGMADALVLANRADATLFVISQPDAKRGSLGDSLRRLERGYANTIGVILTKVVAEKGSHYDYSYYYGYGDRTAPALTHKKESSEKAVVKGESEDDVKERIKQELKDEIKKKMRDDGEISAVG